MKPTSASRRRRTFLISAAAVVCSAIALLAGALPAGAAQQGQQGKALAVTLTTSPVSAVSAGRQAPASVVCAPALNQFSRTQLCWLETLTFIFFINGRQVGHLEAFLVQSIQLNPAAKRREVLRWTEHDTVVSTVARGRTAPVLATMKTFCDHPCRAVAHLHGFIRRGLTGRVDYTDQMRVDEVNQTPTQYELLAVAPPFAPLNTAKWHSPLQYRCDNALTGIKGPGCVFREFTPTLTVSRREFGAAAALIQWAQVNMSAHWGWQGHGKPLKRLAGRAAIDANRGVICETDFQPFPPWVAEHGTLEVKDSCDEFPFAATYESGAMRPFGVKTGAACQQVKAVKTSDTGSPAQIWNAVRPFSKFIRHAAKCVRGHIPITLNVELGRDGYRAFIGSERLLDTDPFWLAVTG